MAVAARRRPATATPASPAPTPKPQLNLEEWEARAPLSDLASQSIGSLKVACEQRKLPLKFVEELDNSRASTPKGFRPPSSSRPSTPIQGLLQNNFGSPSTTTTGLNANASRAHPLHPTQPISTPQQFYDWFAVVERTLSHAQESHFRKHLDAVSAHLARCDGMMQRICEVEVDVHAMGADWRSVEEGGESLQIACERLLEERDRLIEVTDSIAIRLEYYQELDHATRMLNHPGEALVLQDDFLLMVERVDVCIEYFQEHRHFSEAEVYLLRFQQCMTRAMTLIKMYFVGTLRALSADVQRRIAEKDVSSTSQTHLLYSKFSALSPQLSPLLSELERRAASHPDELLTLLGECHVAYLGARKGLVSGVLMGEIRLLDPSGSELVELARAGCSYLKQLCTDEFNLYRRFFNSGEDKLYRYLEGLCDYLYDDLRPRILHEPSLTVLCQVCTVLQALMVLDVSANGEGDNDSDDENDTIDLLSTDNTITGRLISLVGAPTPKGPSTRPLRRLHISHLLQMILQDAQTRLFFKAQAMVQSEIRYYAPQEGDLDYPGLITAHRTDDSATKYPQTTGDAEEGLFAGLPSKNSIETWYPTLRKLHWILSLLYDFVKPAIFQDMAHEAISMCRLSLSAASELLSAKASKDALDANLFLIRHLLFLKEIANMLGSVGDESGGRAVEIKAANDGLGSLLRGTTSIFNAGNLLGGLASLGMPRDAGHSTDVKIAIDEDLKKACEALIAVCANSATQSLQSPSANISSHAVFLESCEKDVRASVARLRIYLEDERTVGILVQPLLARIVEIYDEAIASGRRGSKDGGEVGSGKELWVLLRKWSEV